jgi:hypothetical protein
VPQFAPALIPWTGYLFPGETPAETRLRIAVCALSDIAWRDDPDLRAEESFRRLLRLPFIGLDHAERVFIAAAIHARYAGKPDAPWLSPAIEMLSPATRRRAQILGCAILLAYRLSGSVSDVLAESRLRIEPGYHDWKSSTARAPDSEVVEPASNSGRYDGHASFRSDRTGNLVNERDRFEAVQLASQRQTPACGVVARGYHDQKSIEQIVNEMTLRAGRVALRRGLLVVRPCPTLTSASCASPTGRTARGWRFSDWRREIGEFPVGIALGATWNRFGARSARRWLKRPNPRAHMSCLGRRSTSSAR